MRAGDVVVFTEALTHGTLPWQGAEQRRTLVFKYSPGNSAYSHVQWPDDLLAACTARQRLLLQPPSVGGHQPVVPWVGCARCRRVGAAGELGGEPLVGVADRPLGDGRAGRQALEAVRRAGVDLQVDGHAGVAQPHRVVDVLVGEPVDGADGDERRRQPGEVGGPRRRGVRLDVGGALAVAEVRGPAVRVGGSAARPDRATGSTS